jgi:hypothetical protein
VGRAEGVGSREVEGGWRVERVRETRGAGGTCERARKAVFCGVRTWLRGRGRSERKKSWGESELGEVEEPRL